MRVRCISRYRSAQLTADVGAVLDVSDAEARRLMVDAPGCWEDADAPPAAKALDAPPRDTMVKRSVRK
jgi:hypothetical protein